MVKTEREGFLKLLRAGFPELFFSTIYACGVVIIEAFFGDKLYSLPSGIASVTGLAVAFFV
ncbi:MAG: ion channel-forming bestrophin family protein, partial [Campylobacterota bacterium]|nr:ion channel-forming bestrophin family protein [Campylobacterota bacterium]